MQYDATYGMYNGLGGRSGGAAMRRSGGQPANCYSQCVNAQYRLTFNKTGERLCQLAAGAGGSCKRYMCCQ